MKGGSTFRVDNVFSWVIDAHNAGFSQEDILFILKTMDWLEPMRKIIKESEETPSDSDHSRNQDAA